MLQRDHIMGHSPWEFEVATETSSGCSDRGGWVA